MKVGRNFKPNDLDWAAALRAPQIRMLVARTGFQMDRLNDRNPVEITDTGRYLDGTQRLLLYVLTFKNRGFFPDINLTGTPLCN